MKSWSMIQSLIFISWWLDWVNLLWNSYKTVERWESKEMEGAMIQHLKEFLVHGSTWSPFPTLGRKKRGYQLVACIFAVASVLFSLLHLSCSCFNITDKSFGRSCNESGQVVDTGNGAHFCWLEVYRDDLFASFFQGSLRPLYTKDEIEDIA